MLPRIVIVTGDIVAKAGHFDALFAAGRAHSARSRAEPGCIGHDCFADPDQPNRLFFYERWSDDAALQAHLAMPGIAELTAAFRDHAASRGTMQVYGAELRATPG